jgi:site-specific recombinase XerD
MDYLIRITSTTAPPSFLLPEIMPKPDFGNSSRLKSATLTRGRAYAQATREFLAWCESACIASIAEVKPLHVAAYIEQLGQERAASSVKQRLAAIHHLLDWLMTGQVN